MKASADQSTESAGAAPADTAADGAAIASGPADAAQLAPVAQDAMTDAVRDSSGAADAVGANAQQRTAAAATTEAQPAAQQSGSAVALPEGEGQAAIDGSSATSDEVPLEVTNLPLNDLASATEAAAGDDAAAVMLTSDRAANEGESGATERQGAAGDAADTAKQAGQQASTGDSIVVKGSGITGVQQADRSAAAGTAEHWANC